MASTDPEEQELLALQEQFRSSSKEPAARIKKSLFKSRAHDHDLVENRSQREHIPGERVSLDLFESSRIDGDVDNRVGIIKDIVERETVPCHPRTDPDFLTRGSIMPKKINWRERKPLESRSGFSVSTKRTTDAVKPSTTTRANQNKDLQSQIDDENMSKIRSMTHAEIEAERNDIRAKLDPGVLAALDRRRQRQKLQSSAPQSHMQDDFGPSFTSQQIESIPEVKTCAGIIKERELAPATDRMASVNHDDSEEYTTAEEALNSEIPHVHTESCYAQESELSANEAESAHFPAPTTNDLDPHAASFLTDLKSKYFAHLDHDPSSLAWMQPPTEAEDLSDYHPSHESLMPAQLRFDFQGNFLAPRTSREVDGDIGLHHHADAPLAAGYTIPELAHLSRSSYPSQACIAIQTLGRVMYKVGKQFYGHDISGKLKSLIEKTMVETTLLERARDRHLGVSSYATEALWQANLGREGTVYEGQ